jgi:signal transduction histidine kinase
MPEWARREASPRAHLRNSISRAKALPMSGTIEYAEVPRRAALSITELSVWLTVSVATVTGVTWALANTPAPTRDIALPVFLLGAGGMFGLGIADISRRRDVHFARALMVAGVLWSLAALAASDEPLTSSVGHVSLWCGDLAIAYLLLSYPSGRLTDQTSRNLFVAVALVVGVLFLPTALLAQFPHPAPWSMCTAHCPNNVFKLAFSPPAAVLDLIYGLRDLLVVAGFAAIAVILVRRARQSQHLLGQLYAPVAAFAVLQFALFVLYFPLRAVAPDSGVVSVLAWTFVLALPATGLACGTGRLYRRIRTANVLEHVARSLKDSRSAADVRIGLAGALQDPSLRILHSFPGDYHAWIDESGAPVVVTLAGGDQQVTEVASGSWRIAVLHDGSLAEDRPLVLAAASYALTVLENHSLTGELRDSLQELAESRASRLTAEQDTRQKIERDLHDGAQQRLLALRLKLGLVASDLAERDPAGADALGALERDVDAAIDDLRSLARGIYPYLLVGTGLREALRATGRSAALPTRVQADHLRRYSPEIETTVYFSCSEALQNAAKHAASATGVTISVWQDRDLHFEVRDDGEGFDVDATPHGTGLNNLADRLAAVGGTMRIESAPGQGTALSGSIPLP